MARNGTGVKAASKSSIEIEFQYQGKRCRERIAKKPTPANLRRLIIFRDELLESIANGSFKYQETFPNSSRFKVKPEIDTLAMSYWLDKLLDRREPYFKASTYDTLRKTTHYLKPVFGNLKITEIKRKHVREWCATLTCGNKQIKKYVSALKDALECAIDDEVIDANPLRDFTYKKIEEPKADYVDPLSKEELTILLNSTTGQLKNLIQFAIWTGLRSSELVALEWGDIDFVRNAAQIKRAKTQAANKPEITKTKSGTREIKLLPPALAALAAQKQYTFLQGERIFQTPQGKPYSGPFQIWSQWKRALLKAGIRYRNPYQTRHTFASYMLSSGENLNWLSSQMGHSNISVTLKHYARFIPDQQEQYGLKAVELFADMHT